MDREKINKNKHKVPKFRDSYDEDLKWQDRMEIQRRRRKLNRKPQGRKAGFENW